MKNFSLGSQSMGKSILYFIRLIHPVSFSNCDFHRLDESIAIDTCSDWESVHKLKNADSFLGKINLGTIEGKDVYLDTILYKNDSNKEYSFFRLKDLVLQKFKSLYFTPEKDEFCLRMLSCEFIPFQHNIGFISICFCIISNSSREIRFSDAISVNYSLPFIQHSFKPLILRMKDKEKNIIERKTNIPTLFQKIYDSLMMRKKEESQYIHVQDCWDVEAKFDSAGSLNRLLLMSYLVFTSDNQTWESEEGESLRHFYHQITRWSEDDYQHDIAPQVQCNSPEKTSNGYSTRFCSFSERGITCIGLGANEFERSNFLPKFKGSYYFALLVAWYFSILQKNNFANLPKEVLSQLTSFPVTSLFEERPRQEFFEACLEYKKLEKEFTSKISHNLQVFSKIATHEISKEEKYNRFCSQGDSWEVIYDGEKKVIKNIKGMQYIAYLLKNKGRKFSASELIEIFNHLQKSERLQTNKNLLQEEQENLDQESSSNILDEVAIREYRERLNILEDQKQKIKNVDKIQEEIDFISNELRKNGNYKEKPRKFNSNTEKQRKNIRSAITSAIKNISKHHDSLGRHLHKSIKTGSQCSYLPEQANILWTVDFPKIG